MAGKIKIAVQYWWEVFKNATKATAKLFDVRGNILIVLGYFGLFLIASFLLANGVLAVPLISDLTGDLNSEFRLALAFVFVFAVTILLNSIYLPAKVDKEQRDLIDYFQNRHRVPKVRLRAIIRDNWVGIEVFNMEDNLRIDITSVIIKDIPQLEVLASPIQLITEREGHSSFRLPPKVWKAILLAKFSNNGTGAHLVGSYDQLSIETGTYDILTQLDGQVEYNDFRPIETTWQLKFNEAKAELTLKKLEDLEDDETKLHITAS